MGPAYLKGKLGRHIQGDNARESALKPNKAPNAMFSVVG